MMLNKFFKVHGLFIAVALLVTWGAEKWRNI